MNKSEILELKSRLKKTGCTITKMSGCYVNASKEVLVNFNETFLNLEEDEFYKYLEIAKKTLSGSIGNNLLNLEFPTDEENEGGKQQFLMGLRASKLKNEGLLETFFQHIIESYSYVGNYLILVFHDAYDVMTKSTDNLKLDESEEVYEYLLFAICPVNLTKPGLGYIEGENKIGARNRDWVVGPPDTGFVFPAFTERSTDIHSVMFYTKDTEEPHNELIELVLGCPIKATGSQQKNTFHAIIKNAIQDSEKSDSVICDIQESLSQIIEEQAEFQVESEEPVFLTKETVQEILVEKGLSEEITAKIEASYAENFSEEPPVIDYLIDKKVQAENEKRKITKTLVEQIHKLEEKLEEKKEERQQEKLDSYPEQESYEDEFDVILNVKADKMDQIKTSIIEGKKYLVIPIEENEHSKINGVADFEFPVTLSE